MGDWGCGGCWNMYIKSTNQVIKKPILCFEFKLLWATPGYFLYSFFCIALSVANDSSSESWFQWRVYRHDQCGNRSSSLQPIAGYVKTKIMQNTEEFVVWIAAVTELILYDLSELYSWVKLRLLQDKKRTCYEDLSVLHKLVPSPWWATVWQKPLLWDLHTWFLCLSVSLSHVSRRVILRFDRCCITDHISACRRSVEFPELCVYHRARSGKKNCLTERSSLLMCTTTTVKDPCAVLQTFLQSALDLDILPLKL